MTPIRIFLIWKIGVSELYVSGEDHQYRFGPGTGTIDSVPRPSWLRS